MLMSIAMPMMTAPATMDTMGFILPQVLVMISWKQTMMKGLAAV